VSEKYLETIKALDGILYHLEYHQWRLDSVLQTKKRHELKLLSPPKKGLYRCRVVYTQSDIEVEYIKYSKRQVKKLKLIYDDTIEYEKKYEDREKLNQLFLDKGEADDILIIKNSLVSDTSIANVAFYDGNTWVTPSSALLEGTTRKRLLESGKIVLKEIKAEEIKGFQKIALMNAMIDFDIIAQDNLEDIIC
jgi:4-amino-4-deoxychorismate lyase